MSFCSFSSDRVLASSTLDSSVRLFGKHCLIRATRASLKYALMHSQSPFRACAASRCISRFTGRHSWKTEGYEGRDKIIWLLETTHEISPTTSFDYAWCSSICRLLARNRCRTKNRRKIETATRDRLTACCAVISSNCLFVRFQCSWSSWNEGRDLDLNERKNTRRGKNFGNYTKVESWKRHKIYYANFDFG